MPETLSCKTSAMCEKEMWTYMLAYNPIRLLMVQAADSAGVLPRQLSFKHTVQLWTCWSQRQFRCSAHEDTAAFFELIAQIRVGNRPGRIEPRPIKQRPKPFSRLQTTRQKARENITRLAALTIRLNSYNDQSAEKQQIARVSIQVSRDLSPTALESILESPLHKDGATKLYHRQAYIPAISSPETQTPNLCRRATPTIVLDLPKTIICRPPLC